MRQLADLLFEVVEAFETAGIPYAVCGGLAMAMHGFPRATFDVDLLVLAQEVEHAAATARSIGFDTKAPTMTFADGEVVIHRLSRLVPELEEFIPLDLIEVSPALQPAWEERQRLRVGSAEMWVLTREGLKIMKRLRGSNKDIIDMETLDENP